MPKVFLFILASIALAFCVSPALAQDRVLIGVTTATTTGDADGIVGMHDLCETAFPGSRMCTSADIVRNGIDGDIVLPLSNSAWVQPSMVDAIAVGATFQIFDQVSGVTVAGPSTPLGHLTCLWWLSESVTGMAIYQTGELGSSACSADNSVACCVPLKKPK